MTFKVLQAQRDSTLIVFSLLTISYGQICKNVKLVIIRHYSLKEFISSTSLQQIILDSEFLLIFRKCLLYTFISLLPAAFLSSNTQHA